MRVEPVVRHAIPVSPTGDAGGRQRRKLSENPYLARYNQACEILKNKRNDVVDGSPTAAESEVQMHRLSVDPLPSTSQSAVSGNDVAVYSRFKKREDCREGTRNITTAASATKETKNYSRERIAALPSLRISNSQTNMRSSISTDVVASSNRLQSSTAVETTESTATATSPSCSDCQDRDDCEDIEETNNHSNSLKQALTTTETKANGVSASIAPRHSESGTISLLLDSASTTEFNSNASATLPYSDEGGTAFPYFAGMLTEHEKATVPPPMFPQSDSPIQATTTQRSLIPPLRSSPARTSSSQASSSDRCGATQRVQSTSQIFDLPTLKPADTIYALMPTTSGTVTSINNIVASPHERKIDRLRANNRRLLETTRQQMGKFNRDIALTHDYEAVATNDSFNSNDEDMDCESNQTDKNSITNTLSVRSGGKVTWHERPQTHLRMAQENKRMAEIESMLKTLNLTNKRLEVSA